MAGEGRVVKVLLYFQNDLLAINKKYSLELGDLSEASWILEIQGLIEDERDVLYCKYDRLKRSRATDWVDGESSLIDIESGNVSQYHDVSTFFVTFATQLNFIPDESNPPPNTNDFQPGEVRTWTFFKK